MSNDPTTTTTVRPPCYLLYNPYLQQQKICYRCGYDRQYYETIVNTYFDLCGECDSVLPLYNATCGTTTTTTTTTTTSTTTTTTTTPKPTTTLTPTTYPPYTTTECAWVYDNFCDCCPQGCFCQVSDSLFDDFTDPGPAQKWYEGPCSSFNRKYYGGDGTPITQYFQLWPIYFLRDYQIVNGWVGEVWNNRPSKSVPLTNCSWDDKVGSYLPPDANIVYTDCGYDLAASDFGCQCTNMTRPGSEVFWYYNPYWNYYNYGSNVLAIYDMDCPWVYDTQELNEVNVTLYQIGYGSGYLASESGIPETPKKCSLWYRTKTLTHAQLVSDDLSQVQEGWSDWKLAISIDMGRKNAISGGLKYTVDTLEITIRCTVPRCAGGRNCSYYDSYSYENNNINITRYNWPVGITKVEGLPSHVIQNTTLTSNMSACEESSGSSTLIYHEIHEPGKGNIITNKEFYYETKHNIVFGWSYGCCAGGPGYGYYGPSYPSVSFASYVNYRFGTNSGVTGLYWKWSQNPNSFSNFDFFCCPSCAAQEYGNETDFFESHCSKVECPTETSGYLIQWWPWTKQFKTEKLDSVCLNNYRTYYDERYYRGLYASFVVDPYVASIISNRDAPISVEGMWSYPAKKVTWRTSHNPETGICISSSISPQIEYSLGRVTTESSGFTKIEVPPPPYPAYQIDYKPWIDYYQYWMYSCGWYNGPGPFPKLTTTQNM